MLLGERISFRNIDLDEPTDIQAACRGRLCQSQHSQDCFGRLRAEPIQLAPKPMLHLIGCDGGKWMASDSDLHGLIL